MRKIVRGQEFLDQVVKRSGIITGEVLPVSREMLEEVWRRALWGIRAKRNRGREIFDLNHMYQRLRSGHDLLWVAFTHNDKFTNASGFVGAVITTVSSVPPGGKKFRLGLGPDELRSLTIHWLAGRKIKSWIDSAVERIIRYAREQNVHQLFIKTTARRRAFFCDPIWAAWDGPVAWARDRISRVYPHMRKRHQPGFYRPVQVADAHENQPRALSHHAALHLPIRLALRALEHEEERRKRCPA
ncbi:MAG TPA: hypothetical protein VI455_04180 [Terriglobia bacterium]